MGSAEWDSPRATEAPPLHPTPIFRKAGPAFLLAEEGLVLPEMWDR